MVNINKFKSTEALKKYNIFCENESQTRECFKMLEELGFKTNWQDNVSDDEEGFGRPIIQFNNNEDCDYFTNDWSVSSKNNNFMFFYDFKKIYNKFKNSENPKLEYGFIDFITGKVNIILEDSSDYDNIINYLNKYGVIWNIGRPLKDLNYKGEALSVILENVNGVYRLLYTNETNIDKVKIESSMTVKELFKRFNIQYKKLPSDFEVDENGRIIKINNYKSRIEVYNITPQFSSHYKVDRINNFQKDCIDKLMKFGLLFSTEETAKKYIKYMTVHIKLKTLLINLITERKLIGKVTDNSNTAYILIMTKMKLIIIIYFIAKITIYSVLTKTLKTKPSKKSVRTI